MKTPKKNLQEATAKTKKNTRICVNGHRYYKSSDCPVCPICESERKPKDNFLSLLSAPARRALENKGITTVKQLAGFSEVSVATLHGMGPKSVTILCSILNTQGLSFKK
jgi:predicted RecB family nuclease